MMNGLHYIYAEYCPGDLFWGWWLYATLVSADGTIDRKRYIWLNYEWRQAALSEALDLMGPWPWMERPTERQGTHRRLVERFMEAAPLGIVCDVREDGRLFVPDRSYDARLWEYSKCVREQQLLDWKDSARVLPDAGAVGE